MTDNCQNTITKVKQLPKYSKKNRTNVKIPLEKLGNCKIQLEKTDNS